MTSATRRSAFACVFRLVPVLMLAAAIGLGGQAAAQTSERFPTKDERLKGCIDELRARYGVDFVRDALARNNNRRRTVIVQATLMDGQEASFRCRFKSGYLRGVQSYDGEFWATAVPVVGEAMEDPEDTGPDEIDVEDTDTDPNDEAEAEAEAATSRAKTYKIGAGGEIEVGTPGQEQTETEAESPAEPDITLSPAPGAEADDEAEAEAEAAEAGGFKTYRVAPGDSYSPRSGITCYSKRRACYDAAGKLDLTVTRAEFPSN